jgi:glycosyltransferase involved in cell wall biosynthesis
MVLLAHPTGNQFVRHTARALLEAGLLAEFWTTISWNPHAGLGRLLPAPTRRALGRRAYSPELQPFIHRHPWRQVGHLAFQRLRCRGLVRHETGAFSVDAVYRSLDRRVARRLDHGDNFRAVFAYEDGAGESFQVARRRGFKCCYDLPIAYWQTTRRLLEEEAARRPEWEPTLLSTRDSRAKLERKTAELERADVVFCPSQFVLESLPEEARRTKTCVVAEFGSPEWDQAPARPPEDFERPLRVLFAGAMSQRKGLADVFEAVTQLARRDVELVVLGSPLMPLEFYRKQFAGFRYEPPRPHRQVLELMSACDVLVLPSIVEGRALVQQEALSCSLPLIVTSNAGGQDLVKEGKTGFLVPIRSPEAIAAKIAWLADHREALPAMREAARQMAAECNWLRYRQKIAGAVAEALGQ